MNIQILSPDHARPSGCVAGAFPVYNAVSVFIHVKDRVDPDEEITNATKKLERARAAVQKQRKLGVRREGGRRDTGGERGSLLIRDPVWSVSHSLRFGSNPNVEIRQPVCWGPTPGEARP